MDFIDALEDILHTNAHKAITDVHELLYKHIEPKKQELTRQEKEDQDLINKIFFHSGINRPDDEEEPPPAKMAKIASPSTQSKYKLHVWLCGKKKKEINQLHCFLINYFMFVAVCFVYT